MCCYERGKERERERERKGKFRKRLPDEMNKIARRDEGKLASKKNVRDCMIIKGTF